MADPFDERDLAVVRRAYARQTLAVAGVTDPALEAAFAAVPRERFLGPPPWRVGGLRGGYRDLPSDDPVLVYHDVIIALAAERGVNNGSPTLHAHWLHRAGLAPGARVAHIGAGAGYYTALIARLVGPVGRVVAVEVDPALAAPARANLAAYPAVAVVEGDGAAWPQEPVDCVYVSFLAQRPAEAWLNGLRPGGRLIFPLGVPTPRRTGGVGTLHGAGLRVERREAGFAVEWLGPAYFVGAEGALGEAKPDPALRAAFEGGGIEFVRSLHWGPGGDPARAWYAGAGWSLGYDAVG